MNTREDSQAAWAAPLATTPLDARLQLPGSKSLTNRELPLAALADAPGRLVHPLHSRDAQLMADGLRAMGITIESLPGDGAYGDDLLVTPAAPRGGVSIDVGLAGTAMRFLPIVAALGIGATTFDGDRRARRRPMRATIESLRGLGVEVDDEERGTLPFTVHGVGGVTGGELTIDASESSQFVSALLLAAPRFAKGLTLRHSGERLPSLPHIEMTLDALRSRGVQASSPAPGVWRVEPGVIAARDVTIEPDLSNAAPFLAAALVAGGSVAIEQWPAATTQVGALVPEFCEQLGGTVTLDDGVCTVHGDGVRVRPLTGGTIDFGHAGELAPTFAVLGAFCESPLTLSGIGHIRGHETDRLDALVANLTALGIDASADDDSITVRPTFGARAGDAPWRAFDDHRIATAGALVGLVVEGLRVDDIDATSKTIPQFASLWAGMVR